MDWNIVYVTIFSFLILQVLDVEGTGSISVRLVSYDNPTGTLQSGLCCGGLPLNPCPVSLKQCNHVFHICLGDNNSSCNYGEGRISAGKEGNTLIFDPRSQNFEYTIKFNKWEGISYIGIYVNDTDFTGKTEVVDSFNFLHNETLGTRNYTLTGHRQTKPTKLKIQVRVSCSADYYGPGCDVYCKPGGLCYGRYGRKDFVPGLWKGTFVCENGIPQNINMNVSHQSSSFLVNAELHLPSVSLQLTGTYTDLPGSQMALLLEGNTGNGTRIQLKTLQMNSTFLSGSLFIADKSCSTSLSLYESATTTTTPPLPQRSDISCNADSIDTFVPISMLPSGAPLTWRDPTCSVTSNGTHMISSIGLSQCGTTVTITKDNVEFENELKAQSTNSTANTLIDFGEDAYVIPVKCIYPRTETPMMSYVPLQQHVRFYEKRYGHFDVDIIQYDSDKFSSAIQNIGTPRKVALNSEIYVEVKLNDQFNNGLGIHIDKCIATPTSSPSDSTLYTLLTDGCPASQHVHLYNSPANKVRFGVRAFQFTSQTGSMVYIHCQTSMCEAGTPYCTSNCVTAGRRKRDVAPDQKSHLVSAGPFVLVADEQGTPIRMSTIVASVSAFVAVVACVVAIVGWTRKTRTTSTKEQGLL